MRFSLAAFAVVAALFGSALASPAIREETEHADKVAQGLRLLSFGLGEEPVWKTEDEKLELMRAGAKFIDKTEVYLLDKAASQSRKAKALKATFPAPSHQSTVTPLIAKLDTSKMSANLDQLTSFNNRYYTAQTGQDASNFIQNTLRTLTAGRSDISVSAFKHSWVQTSTILKFAAANAAAPVTIIGAHMDSINLSNPRNGRAPGADDDGTGTVNLIDIVRVLAESGYKPATPLEFHWYAGEEVGLLGSEAIASNYSRSGTQVKAMMELDMTGYFKPGSKEVIALEADYIDEGLNSFVKKLVDTYANIPWAMDLPCGYACSDHASWFERDYPTTMPFEAVTGNDNPRIHSASDTTTQSGFSWSHSLEFAKVGLAYVVELTS